MNRLARQAYLERHLADGLNIHGPAFLDKPIITPHTTQSLESLLRGHLDGVLRTKGYSRSDMPYDLSSKVVGGSIRVEVGALHTEREEAAGKRELERIAEGYRRAKIADDKARAAAHPHRARTFDVGGNPAISIGGMIEDLLHWQPPPEFLNEDRIGFETAIADVIRYLQTRARKAGT